MEISYFGHSCFKIKGKDATIITDPYDKSIGYKIPKTEANIVTISHFHKDHSNPSVVLGNPFIIDSPGEYEIKGVSILGLQSFHDKVRGEERGKNTIYLIEIDGLRICHLGDLGHTLSNTELEGINGVDILLIPVGGTYTISAKEASEVISTIEPKVVIPMHYETNKTKLGIDQLSKFCQEMGICEDTKEKLTVKPNSLAQQEREEIIILKHRG